MKKSNTRFFTFTFLYRKIYILLENTYLENLVCVVTFALPLFHVAGYWKCNNTNAHIDIHWFCRRHTSIQKTSYFNVDFDSNRLFLIFIYLKQVPSI